MRSSRTVGLLLLGLAAGTGVWVWWRRRQKSAGASRPIQDLIAGGGPTADAIQAALGDFSWSVAPKQPATPNTPTTNPIFGDVKGGSSTSTDSTTSSQAASRGAYF